MNDWKHVEIHYANAGVDDTFANMCANALPWEFCFCVLPSTLLGSKGKSAAILVPTEFFQSFGYLPCCTIFIDDILPNLHPSMDMENEFWSELGVDDVRDMLTRLGYIESKELEEFMVGVYKDLQKVK